MFKKNLYIALLCFVVSATNSTISSLSCEIGASLFNGYSCKNKIPYQIKATGITYLIEKDGQTYQMKIKQMSEEEQKNFKNNKNKKPLSIQNKELQPDKILFKKINNSENKIKIDSKPNQTLTNFTNIDKNTNSEHKIDQIQANNTQKEYINVLTHYSIINIPVQLNVELNESIFLNKFKDDYTIQNLKDFMAIDGFKILILDHFENGSLREFLSVQSSLPYEKRFLKTEEDKMKLFLKIVNAVSHLNGSGYVHTDLSPDTIYINEENNPVIGGFDFIKINQSLSYISPLYFITQAPLAIRKGSNIASSEIVISENSKFFRNFNCIAPEIILAKNHKMILFNSKIDSYSLGAVYYYMMYSVNAFDGNDDVQVLEALKQRFILVQAGTSNNSIRIFIKTLSLDPTIRLNIFGLEFNVEHELSFGLESRINSDVEISTDILYTSRYGRTFFDKYSELLFVIIMAFVVIPSTVYLASYKFKQDERVPRNNNQNIINDNHVGHANQNDNNTNPLNQTDVQITSVNGSV